MILASVNLTRERSRVDFSVTIRRCLDRIGMNRANDVGKETANELRELYNFFSVADEAYRTFRAMHLEDRKDRLVEPVVDWVPCSMN